MNLDESINDYEYNVTEEQELKKNIMRYLHTNDDRSRDFARSREAQEFYMSSDEEDEFKIEILKNKKKKAALIDTVCEETFGLYKMNCNKEHVRELIEKTGHTLGTRPYMVIPKLQTTLETKLRQKMIDDIHEIYNKPDMYIFYYDSEIKRHAWDLLVNNDYDISKVILIIEDEINEKKKIIDSICDQTYKKHGIVCDDYAKELIWWKLWENDYDISKVVPIIEDKINKN